MVKAENGEVVKQRKSDNGWRSFVPQVLLAILTGIAFFFAWWFVDYIEIRGDVVQIKDTRFTDRDWERKSQPILKEIHSLSLEVAKIPKEVPPKWFKREVDEIKIEIKEMRKDIQRIRENQNERV